MKKSRQIFKISLFLIITVLFSYWLVQNTDIEKFSIFDTTAVFTYFGVLLGFSITVYTFGLSMTENIKKGILSIEKLSNEQKRQLIQKIIDGFKEIEEDIWAIFGSIILVIITSIAKNVVNPFGWDVEKLQIPEVSNLTLFIFATFCMYDIMKALFNLSQVNLILLKQNGLN